jgi:hypothetical protein
MTGLQFGTEAKAAFHPVQDKLTPFEIGGANRTLFSL